MRAFWRGVREEGWPAAKVHEHLPDAARTPPARRGRGVFGEASFAILSREYMLLNLHLGYHFTTIEALCAEEENKNFIRVQHKDGGAQRDRRIRRVQLLADVFSYMGFDPQSTGDFLSSKISYLSREDMFTKLTLLGRITMMTKQLDMALTNDEVKDWYTRDILKRLRLTRRTQ
jgi:pyruvate,water dikinase